MIGECKHTFVRDGEVTTRPTRNYEKTWARYYCQKCLKHRFVAIKEYSCYSGNTEWLDGSEQRDRPE